MGGDQRSSSPETAPADHGSSRSPLGPFTAKRGPSGRFSTLQVWLKTAIIVLYVVIGTVWLPSYLMEPNSLAIPRDLYAGLMSTETWNTILSVFVSTVWFAALVLGLWAMRWAQKRRFI